MKKLVIIGAGGHGKVVADIAILNGYTEIIFLDDNPEKQECAGFPIVSRIDSIVGFKNYDVFIAIGDNRIRNELADLLQEYQIITLIHPRAVVSRRVSIGKGTVVMAGAVINSDTQIGDFCIINTGATVDHDCVISSFCHVSVGAHIAGTVQLGRTILVGAGCTIINDLSIVSDTIVGAGAVVIRNIFEKGKYIGNPARKLYE